MQRTTAATAAGTPYKLLKMHFRRFCLHTLVLVLFLESQYTLNPQSALNVHANPTPDLPTAAFNIATCCIFLLLWHSPNAYFCSDSFWRNHACIKGFVFGVLLLWENNFQSGQRDRVFMCFAVINEKYCSPAGDFSYVRIKYL